MRQLTCGSLFAGIGGFDLGFERAGIKTIWQVEIDEYCRRVLARHFPEAERFNDVRECGAHNLRKVDVITGGFPCQPFSTSGKRLGTADSRTLWPEMLRVIQCICPRFVVCENVSGLIHQFEGVLEQIYDALACCNYQTLPPLMVPACAFGSPHRRDRVWILAYSMLSYDSTEQAQQQAKRPEVDYRNDWWSAESPVARMVHGLPGRLDRYRGLGNAVVPQVAEWIGRRIVEAELLQHTEIGEQG